MGLGVWAGAMGLGVWAGAMGLGVWAGAMGLGLKRPGGAQSGAAAGELCESGQYEVETWLGVRARVGARG